MVHTGKIPVSESKMNQDVGPIESIIHNEDEMGVMISQLISLKSSVSMADSSPEKSYIVIVNHSATEYIDIAIRLKPGYTIDEITPINSTGTLSSTLNTDFIFNVYRTLNPGGYIIFRYIERSFTK